MKVGDKVYFVDSLTGRTAKYVEITKVARKYAYFGKEERIDLLTREAWHNNDYRLGKAYASKEAYEQERAVHNAWNSFRVKIRDQFHEPKDLTVEKVQTALKILGIAS